MNDPERKQAWKQARAAVRAYSRDPSDSNAAHVEVAWREIRKMDSVSFWHELNPAKLNPSDRDSKGARIAANQP